MLNALLKLFRSETGNTPHVKVLPTYAFCESVHATGYSFWHIRKVTDTGLHLGGGIDTESLCGRVKPFSRTGGGGWDLKVPVQDLDRKHVCPICRDRVGAET